MHKGNLYIFYSDRILTRIKIVYKFCRDSFSIPCLRRYIFSCTVMTQKSAEMMP